MLMRRHVPSECCAKALEAVRALQQATKAGDSGNGACVGDILKTGDLQRGNSVPKRKRTQPARCSSQPALKTADVAEPAS